MTRAILSIFVCVILFSSCKPKTGFESVGSSVSGITFNNLLTNTDSLNVLDVENIYNGGGVGTGDFNNDGLLDLYFTGNLVSNKLYINRGDFHFDDVTEKAHVTGDGRWARGVSVIDINNDGLLDIYVCASLSKDPKKRENLLYMNKGADATGVPQFENQAAAYGLADTSHSTMAAFFDYDNDGDLDMYLVVNEIVKHESPNTFRPLLAHGEHPNTDKLFRNEWDESLKHGVFKNVSLETGITIEGYGHSVNIVDINKDGFKDIYVTNDFLSMNLLYINQRNGTFKNEIKSYFKHTAENAMGQDVIDINNDGLADVIELDMNPEDNSRKKLMMNPIGYQRYTNNDYFGYQYQYVRNVLQLNQGPMVLQNDSIGHPVFSDISFYAGIAETDWSWAPIVADFDNDGFRDIVVTNGFPKDVTDHDFMAFRNKASGLSSKKEILDQIPEVKISNYAFRNNGDLRFTNLTKEWGMDNASFSNGGVYADLDNDGDLDLVINNINDPASIYRNNLGSINKQPGNYIDVKLEGGPLNKNGLGAFIEIYSGKNHIQVYENSPYRGYLSSVINYAHFGLGNRTVVDSLVVKWPAGRMQVLKHQAVNRVLTLKETDANLIFRTSGDSVTNTALFTEVTSKAGIDYQHQDQDFIDFNIQNLLPHKLSQYGPGLAVCDIDGNGLDDIIAGGTFFYNGEAFLQQSDGKFKRESIYQANNNEKVITGSTSSAGIPAAAMTSGPTTPGSTASPNTASSHTASSHTASSHTTTSGAKTSGSKTRLGINDAAGTKQAPLAASKASEDMGLLLFDADGDKDPDLYIASGGYEGAAGSKSYQDRFYLNDGKGNFTEASAALPVNLTSKSCVRAADFDRDGDLDLFVAGRVEPGKYPVPVSSFVYRNDTKDGTVRFTDVSTTIAPKIAGVGLVCDALFTDFDNDGWEDLILLGEWMRVMFLRNNKGKFEDISPDTGIGNVYGWWNSIAPGDFDNDGDIDYILGNFGTNSFYRPVPQYPVNIIAKDFDGNGSFDAITSYFLPQSYSDPEKREVPVHLRDDMIKQIVKTRAKFQTYKAYANATMQNLLNPEQMDSALRLRATDLQSYYLQNDGKGKFTPRLLPAGAQTSIMNGMAVEDFDGDGSLDLVASGNDFGTELSMGKYDASNGVYLKGDGKGKFSQMSILQSGIYLPGNMKALVKLRSANGHFLIAASENQGPLRLLQSRREGKMLPVLPTDVSATIRMKDGRSRKTEFNYGSSFLSQSARFLFLGPGVSAIEITDGKGNMRTVASP